MPGERKGNRTIVIKRRIDGRHYEITTHETNARDAERYWDEFKQKVRERNKPGRGKAPTFTDALEIYTDAKLPSEAERAYLKRLKKHFGDWDLDDLTAADIHKAAHEIYPGRKPATKNRQVITPMRYVLNYAAHKAHLCRPVFVDKFPQDKPAKRRPPAGAVDKMLEATDGYRHLFVATLHYQGWCISETLGLRWNDVDLAERVFWLVIGKARTEKPIPMHDELFELLAATPAEDRRGRVFPWANRSSVRKWWNPIATRLKIRLTPHMLRHEWASARNEDGATASDLESAGSWTSTQSLKDYTDVSIDHARSILNRGRAAAPAKPRRKAKNAQKKG